MIRSPIRSWESSGVLALASDHRSSGHINFCPGWKGYFTSLSEEQKKELRAKYNVSVSDVTPCIINDDCLHCCPSVRQQVTVFA